MKQRNLHSGDEAQIRHNLMNDLAPQDAAGRRHLRPSRRGLIRLGSGLIAVTLLPIPACSPQTAKRDLALIVALFKVGELIYQRTQEISGQTMVVNNGEKTVRLESLFTLQEAFAGGDTADSYSPDEPWSIPPGESSFPFGELHANNVGEHLIQLTLAGSSYETEPFMVV